MNINININMLVENDVQYRYQDVLRLYIAWTKTGQDYVRSDKLETLVQDATMVCYAMVMQYLCRIL